MKKLLVLAVIILGAYGSSLVAQDVKTVFSTKEIVWFGVDFSSVKLVGNTVDFANLNDIRDKQFKAINDLFLAEPDKYNPKKAFKKDKVVMDLSVVEKRNLATDIDKLLVDTQQTLSKEAIEAMIKEYTPKDATTGIGACIVMENCIKLEKGSHATMYIVFFDIATKKVMVCEKADSIAGGFGFRNFWAKPVFTTLDSFNMPALEKKLTK
jgi:hypothetical protein